MGFEWVVWMSFWKSRQWCGQAGWREASVQAGGRGVAVARNVRFEPLRAESGLRPFSRFAARRDGLAVARAHGGPLGLRGSRRPTYTNAGFPQQGQHLTSMPVRRMMRSAGPSSGGAGGVSALRKVFFLTPDDGRIAGHVQAW